MAVRAIHVACIIQQHGSGSPVRFVLALEATFMHQRTRFHSLKHPVPYSFTTVASEQAALLHFIATCVYVCGAPSSCNGWCRSCCIWLPPNHARNHEPPVMVRMTMTIATHERDEDHGAEHVADFDDISNVDPS